MCTHVYRVSTELKHTHTRVCVCDPTVDSIHVFCFLQNLLVYDTTSYPNIMNSIFPNEFGKK